jgi:methylenetetrahydrofolate dehydrogenase (NADP+) / methenyltetrahydrofolate cyclohydrolase
MAQLLEGKPAAAAILAELRPRIEHLTNSGRAPGLAVVLVGHHPASEVYVRNKIKTCEELGIRSWKLTPPESSTTEELLTIVEELNRNPEVDGILVQMPLPRQIDDAKVLQAIDPDKDVDGFHPVNVGRLVARLPGPKPCTPHGVMQLLHRHNINLNGKQAVVIGRSDIVGKPMAMMLLHADATVTIAHSKTKDLPALCRTADILVAAIGKPCLVTREFIKPGAVVVDVGINRMQPEDAPLLMDAPEKLAILKEKGTVLVGDVHPAHALQVAGSFTPVPGGVGLLTIAMLMWNTVELAELAAQRHHQRQVSG